MRYRVLLAVTVLGLVGLIQAAQASAQSLVAALLPASRSVQVGSPATAFVTIINTGDATATSVSISLQTVIPASFSYQTTDPATNVPTGSPNTPVNIAAKASQSFVISITPTGVIPPTEVAFIFKGTNTSAATSIIGLNTLLLSASTSPTPDVIALVGTVSGDGIVNITSVVGAGAFAVATANVGAGGNITVSADTGGTTLPVVLNLCETDPQTGQCKSAIGPTVSTQINAGATPTFTVIVNGTEFIPFDPANNRIFIRFKDNQGVTRGSTSVAVRTNLLGTYTGSGTVTLSSCTFPNNNGTSNGTFTAVVNSQVGNTIGGTFTVASSGASSQVTFSVAITPSGSILQTTVTFTVSVFGFQVGSGTATLNGQFSGDTVSATFSGKAQGIETCNVTGSGSATRVN